MRGTPDINDPTTRGYNDHARLSSQSHCFRRFRPRRHFCLRRMRATTAQRLHGQQPPIPYASKAAPSTFCDKAVQRGRCGDHGTAWSLPSSNHNRRGSAEGPVPDALGCEDDRKVSCLRRARDGSPGCGRTGPVSGLDEGKPMKWHGCCRSAGARSACRVSSQCCGKPIRTIRQAGLVRTVRTGNHSGCRKGFKVSPRLAHDRSNAITGAYGPPDAAARDYCLPAARNP